MALASIYRCVQDVQGNVVTEVLGTITQSGTSTLAALFSDAGGVNPLPNPLINNPTYGSYNVFVAAGSYDMSFLKVGYTFETQRNIVLRDPASGVNTLTGTANQVIVTPASGIGAVTLALPQSIAPDSSVQFGTLGLNTPAPTAPTRLALNGNLSVVGTVGISGAATTLVVTAPSTDQLAMQATGVVRGSGFSVLDATGNNVVGYYSALQASGGTGRYAINCGGNAPSLFNGAVQVFRLQVNGLPTGAFANAMQTILFTRSASHGLTIRPTDSDTVGGAVPVNFYNISDVSVGSIQTTATTTSYLTTSDRRLKEALEPLAGALETVLALLPVQFRWRADGSRGVGVVADEVQPHMPEAVTGTAEAVDDAGQLVPQGLDLSKMVPYLTAAVQTLAGRLAALEARAAC